MVRGTLANIRLRNQLAPGTEGGVTVHLPDGEQMSIYDAAMQYQKEGVPLMIIAGKEYGSGSSRDWAAKGVLLLGVRAVIAESFERIHRTNLVGMGVLPLQFLPGRESRDARAYRAGIVLHQRSEEALAGRRSVTVRAESADGSRESLPGRCSGGHSTGSGVLSARRHPAYVLRQLANSAAR